MVKAIPVERLAWDLAQPGSFEVELVQHRGEVPAGEDVHARQRVDVATGWSKRMTVLGRSQRAMEEGFRRILARLPFPIRHVHPDFGGEFLNAHLMRFWGEQITGRTLSRNRPYRKNDNPRIE